MAIVLNEYEWAEKMIADRKLGAKPFETLTRVAKYYFERKYSKREVRKMLDEFLMQCDPDASLVSWSNTLDKITKTAAKYPPIQIDYIGVTSGELAWIDRIESKQLRRLAFTLLCVSKYWNIVSVNNNNWVNTSEGEIFQMANLVVPRNKQDLMYGDLIRLEYIRQSKRIDNLNVQMLTPETEDSVVLMVSDFRNLGYQYLQYCGEPYFKCERCGITIRETDYQKRGLCRNDTRSGRKHKYCPDCTLEVRLKQNINAVMRRREKRCN